MVLLHTKSTKTAADLMKDVELSLQAAAINSNLTAVGVMPGDLEYGLSRMWQAYSAPSLPWKTHVVRTIEEADVLVEEALSDMKASK